jgi:four helix bundle protein
MAGFEKLKIWQESYSLMLEIYKIAKTLPREERFNCAIQMKRSSSSVPDNIAEGYSSYYYKDKLKGLYIARKEAAETQNHLRKIEGLGYLSNEMTELLISKYEGLTKGINAFIQYVINKRKNDSSL